MAMNGNTRVDAAKYGLPQASRVFGASHPVLHHKLTKLRDERTDSTVFRHLLREVTFYLGCGFCFCSGVLVLHVGKELTSSRPLKVRGDVRPGDQAQGHSGESSVFDFNSGHGGGRNADWVWICRRHWGTTRGRSSRRPWRSSRSSARVSEWCGSSNQYLSPPVRGFDLTVVFAVQVDAMLDLLPNATVHHIGECVVCVLHRRRGVVTGCACDGYQACTATRTRCFRCSTTTSCRRGATWTWPSCWSP